ncbi:hypothetical protein FRC00_002954 [Tulasnella sp. 408]|nr:hypothetical protein FRC00_002954 [Tulasnella sp. 408]
MRTTHDVVQAIAFVPWIPTPIEVYISVDYHGPSDVSKSDTQSTTCSVHIDHIVQPPSASYTFEILDPRRRLGHLFEAFVTTREETPINHTLSIEGGGRQAFRGGVVVMQRAGTQKNLGKHIAFNTTWSSAVLRFLLEQGNLTQPLIFEMPKHRVRRPAKKPHDHELNHSSVDVGLSDKAVDNTPTQEPDSSHDHKLSE